jgi:anti-sigma regulatory factor (Ser/Thr protein kinase)
VEPELELTLPARAESLAIVRDTLRALGGALAIDDQKLADICLAATEACTNVVLHAYPDGAEGPLEVVVFGDRRDQDELMLVVSDCGRGTHEPTRTPGLGLGLQLITALAESACVSRNGDGRTEVEMIFSLNGSLASPAKSPANATALAR